MACAHLQTPSGTWGSNLRVPLELLLDNLVNAIQKLAPAVLWLGSVSEVLILAVSQRKDEEGESIVFEGFAECHK